MKSLKVRLSALLLLIVILTVTALPSFAASQPTKYSSTSNSGTRDVACTTLDGTTAAGYYTGSYAYDTLSTQSSSAILQSLRTLMTSTHTHTTSYSDCKNYANSTDCESNSGKCLTLYSSYTTSYNASTTNREHVWPKSLGNYDTSGPGADLHHIRPTEITPNSNRGNLKYGEVAGGKTSYGNASGYEAGTYGSYFEPLDNVKGDVARICLYMYVRYGGESQYTCSSITKVFQSVDVLLEWCELDPVDTWEMGRNEVIYAIQGNRNVFIDYPEYAWLIFGEEIPAAMTTPSGMASNSTAGGGSTGSGSGGTGDSTAPDNPPVTECTHASTEVRGVIPCGGEGGMYTGDTYCTECDELLEEGTYIPMTSHAFEDGEVVIEPTETAGGMQEQTCIYCGETNVRIIPSLNEQKKAASLDLTGTLTVAIPVVGGVSLLAILFFIFKKKLF